MTAQPVAVEDLIVARAALVDGIVTSMPQAHRQFLVSFESGAPDWTLLDVPRADRLPAVKWRQQNLAKLTRNKRIAGGAAGGRAAAARHAVTVHAVCGAWRAKTETPQTLTE
jgi:hypothetical protein